MKSEPSLPVVKRYAISRSRPKLARNILLGELPRVLTEHIGALLHGHVHLVTQRHQALSQVHVVLLQALDGDHVEVEAVEDEGLLASVRLLLLDERHWVLAPMSQGVEMVGSVVAVIEAVPVALKPHVSMSSLSPTPRKKNNTNTDNRNRPIKILTGTSIRVMLDL